jgi:hypothetical protein
MEGKKEWKYVKVGPVTLFFDPPYQGRLSYEFHEERKQDVTITNIEIKSSRPN